MKKFGFIFFVVINTVFCMVANAQTLSTQEKFNRGDSPTQTDIEGQWILVSSIFQGGRESYVPPPMAWSSESFKTPVYTFEEKKVNYSLEGDGFDDFYTLIDGELEKTKTIYLDVIKETHQKFQNCRLYGDSKNTYLLCQCSNSVFQVLLQYKKLPNT